MIRLLTILFYFSSCFAISDQNIYKIFYERSKQYNTKSYEHIYQLSPARTGSTLIYNILMFLFKDTENFSKNSYSNDNSSKVSKHDSFSCIKVNDKNIYFITVRNPYEAIYSTACVSLEFINYQRSLYPEDIIRYVAQYFSIIELSQHLQKNNCKVVLLKYEDFNDNFDYILKIIENSFDINICDKDKNLIYEYFSKDKVLEFIEKYSSFREYDEVTHFHGNHIRKNREIDPILMNMIINALKPYKEKISQLGYQVQ